MKTLMILIVLISVKSYANLRVYPTRVVLTNSEPTAQISLRHEGPSAMEYSISTIYYEMKSDGAMVEKNTKGEITDSAKDLIRYSPKRIKLEPGISQTVRLVLKKNLQKEGEYRTHIKFEQNPNNLNSEISNQADQNLSSFQLNARLAVAVPVVVSFQEVSPKVEIGNVKIEKVANDPLNRYFFSLDITKQSKGSIYGNLVVYSKNKAGKLSEVTRANGISSYIDRRSAQFPMNENPVAGDYVFKFENAASGKNEELSSAVGTLK